MCNVSKGGNDGPEYMAPKIVEFGGMMWICLQLNYLRRMCVAVVMLMVLLFIVSTEQSACARCCGDGSCLERPGSNMSPVW